MRLYRVATILVGPPLVKHRRSPVFLVKLCLNYAGNSCFLLWYYHKPVYGNSKMGFKGVGLC